MTEEKKACLDCVTWKGATPYAPYKTPYSASEVRRLLEWWLGGLALSGLLWVFLRGLLQMVGAFKETIHTLTVVGVGISYVVVSVVMAIYTVVLLCGFFFHFIPKNLVCKHRGFYRFLDNNGALHTHCKIPFATPYAATPVILCMWEGKWWRKDQLIGAPAGNWCLVGQPNFNEMLVEDMNGHRFPLNDPATVLSYITRFVSMQDVVMSLKRSDDALDALGIGVQKLILWALANKDRVRSQHVRALRELMEELLVNLQREGRLQKEQIATWRDAGQAWLEEERTKNALADEASRRVREKPGEVA